MLFRDFLYIEQIKLSNNEVKTTTPIQKCAGNTYYGYYLKEQNKGCSEFSSQIACFEMDVLHSTLSHERLLNCSFRMIEIRVVTWHITYG